jgi:hypothetical protein
MRNVEFSLLCIIFLLVFVFINRKWNRSIQPRASTCAQLTREADCTINRRASHVGFGATFNVTDEETRRHALRQLESAERLVRREAAPRGEAWALLLDGDDAAQHYTNAALAHVHALQSLQQRKRDVLVLLNEDGFHNSTAKLKLVFHGSRDVAQRVCRKRFAAAGAKVVLLKSLSYNTSRVALVKHVNKIQIWELVDYDKIAFIDLDMTIHESLGWHTIVCHTAKSCTQTLCLITPAIHRCS